MWVKRVTSLQACMRVSAPTTVDERLQQLLLGQALVHFHPHYVTAEPLRLLLRLREDTEARRVRIQR